VRALQEPGWGTVGVRPGGVRVTTSQVRIRLAAGTDPWRAARAIVERIAGAVAGTGEAAG